MRVIELFAGIGACSTALKRLGKDVEIVDAVEIDKYAIASFNAIHGTNFETQDITIWDKDFKDIDLITHGSPCQDFSVAGKQAGGDIGSGTRSSLMYETIRIVGKIRPKYVLWENVKNILSKNHKHNFDAYVETMTNLGYNSFYEVLNAKDYGIPQNRERVYTISIRRDIPQSFNFPEKEELFLRLKDVLEEKVDEKYYLQDTKIDKIVNSDFMQERKRIQEKDICDTLLARDYKDPKCVRIGGIFDGETSKHQAGSVYDKEGLAPTLDIMQGGWRQPSIVEEPKLPGAYGRNFGSKGKIEEDICSTLQAAMGSGGGNIPLIKEFSCGEFRNLDEYIDYLKEVQDQTPVEYEEIQIENGPTMRIRKLTPRECWRLMGFSDEDFNKAQAIPMSNSQLYKQAGNSIVVNVLEKIFNNLF